jgi:hypothetical protein
MLDQARLIIAAVQTRNLIALVEHVIVFIDMLLFLGRDHFSPQRDFT